MKRIGVLGGGQLGMMLFQEAEGLDIDLHFLDPDPKCSCIAVGAQVVTGDFKEYQTVMDFGQDKDILTVEIEHVNTQALKDLEKQGKKVFPQPNALEMIQDKGLQKRFYEENDIPTAPFELVDGSEEINLEKWSIPFVLKSRKGGYDGKGVQLIRKAEDLDNAIQGKLVVEALADIEKELSVIVARSESGEVSTFPLVEMEFDPVANLVSALISPADVDSSVERKASELAKDLISKMNLVGLLAVEMFLNKDGSVWINEVAPRPHNSGHQTIEGNNVSQYGQHLRAIAGLPLDDTSSKGFAVMVNLLGADGYEGNRKIVGTEKLNEYSNAYLHDYFKAITRPKRKMGHITVVDSDRDNALQLALRLQEEVQFISDN